jgi:hypothetical protein
VAGCAHPAIKPRSDAAVISVLRIALPSLHCIDKSGSLEPYGGLRRVVCKLTPTRADRFGTRQRLVPAEPGGGSVVASLPVNLSHSGPAEYAVSRHGQDNYAYDDKNYREPIGIHEGPPRHVRLRRLRCHQWRAVRHPIQFGLQLVSAPLEAKAAATAQELHDRPKGLHSATRNSTLKGRLPISPKISRNIEPSCSIQ